MDKYVVFIPVRGGSKSIPLKNIRLICGRPLVYWTIDAAVGSPSVDRVYVCTDSPAIREKVASYIAERGCGEKLKCIDRPAETATDTASTESAMLHFAKEHSDFSHIVLVQATSPLLTADHLTKALADYEQHRYDSMLSVVRQKRFCWEQQEDGGYVPTNYDFFKRPRRQEFNGYLVENGAFYVTPRKALLETGCRLSGRVGAFEMPEETYFEIDEPSDWVIIEKLLSNCQKPTEQAERAARIKLLLTDCDGVLTDAGMYYSESGDELKKFNTRDGMAVSMLRQAGIGFGIITGEKRKLVEWRAAKLKADFCRVGVTDKAEVLEEICQQTGLAPSEIAYCGDDCNDVGILSRVGFPCTVSDGAECVRQLACYVTKSRGGDGAIREVAEFILKSKSRQK